MHCRNPGRSGPSFSGSCLGAAMLGGPAEAEDARAAGGGSIDTADGCNRGRPEAIAGRPVRAPKPAPETAP